MHPLTAHLRRNRSASGLSMDVLRRLENELERIEQLDAENAELREQITALKASKGGRKEHAA